MALTLHYDYVNNPSLSNQEVGPDTSITRATNRTMVDADGYIRELQDNEAAFDGATWSQNISEDFSEAFWGKTRSGITSSQSDPFGGTDAYIAYADLNNNTHFLAANISLQGGAAVISCYAKAETYDFVCLYGVGPNDGRYFDLTNGTVESNFVADPLDSGIEDVGNGWYRCWIVVDTTVALTAARIYIAEADGDQTFIGDNASGIYVYGPQLEDVSGAWDSQNLLLQSNQFDTTWFGGGSGSTTVSASAGADPLGGSDAWQIVDDGLGGSGTIAVRQDPTLEVGKYYIYSVYVKADGADWAFLLANGTASNVSAYFDLTNGVVGTVTAAAWTSGIDAVGNGWYRIYLGVNPDSSDVTDRFRIYVAEGNGDASWATFDGTHSLLFYGAMLEEAKPNQTAPGTYTETTTAAVTNYSPSTYIPTTTAAVSSLSGTSNGLLVEEARTNICLQSEDFSTTWTIPDAGTLTTNQTTAPDGSLTADLFDDGNTSTSGNSFLRQSLTVSTSTKYTVSVFAKADQTDWIRVDYGVGNVADAYSYFDLGNGVEGTPGAGVDSSGIEDYGNGWYRCWISVTSDSVDNSPAHQVLLADGDGDITLLRDGSHSVFVWGAQFEQGAFPTSYIPTTTASVTRNADDVQSSDVTWFNEDAGTFYTHANTFSNATSKYVLFVSDGGLTTDCHRFWISANYARIRMSESGTNYQVDSFAEDPQIFANEASPRIAWAYQENDLMGYYDGTAEAAPITTMTPLVNDIDELHIGQAGSETLQLNGLIKEIRYYDERLTDDQLLDMSNGIFPSGKAFIGNLVRPLVSNLVRPLVR
jgi:hypothetical protein